MTDRSLFVEKFLKEFNSLVLGVWAHESSSSEAVHITLYPTFPTVSVPMKIHKMNSWKSIMLSDFNEIAVALNSVKCKVHVVIRGAYTVCMIHLIISWYSYYEVYHEAHMNHCQLPMIHHRLVTQAISRRIHLDEPSIARESARRPRFVRKFVRKLWMKTKLACALG